MATAFAATPLSAGAASGVGNIPQGTQTDWAYARSYTKAGVTNVFATTQQTSCYRPENPFFLSLGPNDGYTGMTACGATTATTGEDTGLAPYPSQVGSNAGYPAASPMLVKDHSESDIRVDPTNPNHLIGSSKWVVSAEGYNHLLGFYESWDGGMTWPTQGHIPGYEGWSDNTDPVGALRLLRQLLLADPAVSVLLQQRRLEELPDQPEQGAQPDRCRRGDHDCGP